jgi:hypothetical protein
VAPLPAKAFLPIEPQPQPHTALTAKQHVVPRSTAERQHD